MRPRVERRAGNRHNLAAALAGFACCDQRSTAFCGFDDHDAERKRADNPVPDREMAWCRLSAWRHFSKQKPAFGDAFVKVGILGGIYNVNPAGDHRHRAAGQRTVMRRRIDPAGKARYDHMAFACQVLGKRLCQSLCVDRRIARTDNPDRRP